MSVVGAVILALALGLFGIGIYTVYGIAKDPSARLNDFKQQLLVTSSGPNASFAWTSQGYNVTVRDTSTDNGSTITSWVWSFGDGTNYTGVSPPAHTYSVSCPMCTENVTLTVEDRAGHQSVATAAVMVQRTGGSSGVGQSPTSSVKIPGPLVNLSAGLVALELLIILFLICGAVALAGWRLLRREPEGVQVPVRPRSPPG